MTPELLAVVNNYYHRRGQHWRTTQGEPRGVPNSLVGFHGGVRYDSALSVGAEWNCRCGATLIGGSPIETEMRTVQCHHCPLRYFVCAKAIEVDPATLDTITLVALLERLNESEATRRRQ